MWWGWGYASSWIDLHHGCHRRKDVSGWRNGKVFVDDSRLEQYGW